MSSASARLVQGAMQSPSEVNVMHSVSNPPTRGKMPSLRGKKLVQWLQTIIKTAEGSVVDLTAVTKIYKEEAGPSPMSADLFLTLLCRLFADAARHEDGNRTYLLGARWITNAEVDNILLEEMTTELRAIELARIEAMDVEAKKVRMQMAKRGDEVSSFLLTTGLWKASQEKNGMQNGAAAKAVAGEQIMRKDSTLSVDGNNIDSDYDEDPDDYYTTDEHLSYMYQNWLDVQAEFEDAYDKVCLGKGVIVREWVEQVLITDSESRMDPFGVHVAFCSSTTAALLKDEPEVSATVMAMIMTSVFPDIEWKAEGDDPPLLCGVRWRNLDSAVACRTLSVCNCTGKVQKESHKLLHEPDPRRTRLWLQMLFIADDKATTGLQGILDMHEEVWARYHETDEQLHGDKLLDVIFKTFRKARKVNIFDNVFVVHGIKLRPAKHVQKAEEVMKQDQQRRLRLLIKAGKVDPQPKSLFAQKLMQDPLLMAPKRRSNGQRIHGPMLDRFERRQADPRLPLGDWEPGFPGISMKKEQLKYKANVTAYKRQVIEEFDKAAGVLNAAPPGARPSAA